MTKRLTNTGSLGARHAFRASFAPAREIRARNPLGVQMSKPESPRQVLFDAKGCRGFGDLASVGGGCKTAVLSNGYTLLELLLVLVVLVMVLALTWPAMTRRLSHHELRDAGMQVAEAIAETRMNAMDSGEPWVFRYWPQTGHYESGPLFREHAEIAAARDAESSTENEGVVKRVSSTDAKTTDSRDSNGAMPSELPRPRASIVTGELTGGFVMQDEHPGVQDDLTSLDDPIAFDEQATASGLRVEDEPVPDMFNQVESADDRDLAQIPARWVVFDSLGKSEDFQVIVATLDQRASVAVNVRGVSGAISLDKPQQVIEPSDLGGEPTSDFEEDFNIPSTKSSSFTVDRSSSRSDAP